MGNTIASAQKQTMENQQRQMMAMQMATSRDMVMWMGGVWLMLSGVAVSGKRLAIPPLAALSILLAYNVDFAYGNKLERIRAEHYRILKQEKRWFTAKEYDMQVKKQVDSEPPKQFPLM